MQHFFVTGEQVRNGVVVIEGSDVRHMKNVLRMKPGEVVSVSDGNNHDYRCKIERYEEDEVRLEILEEQETDRELSSNIYLFQSLPKQDKMEWIVQKAVELGVHEIVPVASKRSVVKLVEKKAQKKVERWQSIAESAAKQAGRGYIPRIGQVQSFGQALHYAAQLEAVLLPYELAEGFAQTRRIIEGLKPGQSIGIFIGPEGGFEREEAETAAAMGAKIITLGRRILRTETAGLTTLSILMYHLEGE